MIIFFRCFDVQKYDKYLHPFRIDRLIKIKETSAVKSSFVSQHSKDFNCDITKQSRYSQAAPEWKESMQDWEGSWTRWQFNQITINWKGTHKGKWSSYMQAMVWSSARRYFWHYFMKLLPYLAIYLLILQFLTKFVHIWCVVTSNSLKSPLNAEQNPPWCDRLAARDSGQRWLSDLRSRWRENPPSAASPATKQRWLFFWMLSNLESLETLNRTCDPEKKVLFVYKGHRWTFSTRPQVQVPGVRSRWVEIVALAGLAAWLLGVTKRLQHFSHFCFGHTCALSCARHFWISFPCENVFGMKAPKITGLLYSL